MSEGELGGFGDQRLRRTGERLLAALQAKPSICLRELADGHTQERAFGRFLDDGSVSADEMLAHAGQLTGPRAAGRHVLAIQDATELRFAGQPARKRGFGTAGNGRDLGLFLHPTLAVDAVAGGVIGLVGAQVIEAKEFVKPIVAASIAATRVMQIVVGRNSATAQPLGDAASPADQPTPQAFSAKLQGRTDKPRNPHAPDTLARLVWIVARLGGWCGYTSKGYRPPGPKTIAPGINKLDAMTEGWKLAHSALV